MQTLNLEDYSSVVANKPAERTSSKYKFIPSMEVVRVMESQGWIPSKVAEVRCRKESLVGFQKHKIEFVPANQDIKVGDTSLRIILTNSHNGLSAFRFDVGLFRLVCSNGLVVGNPCFSHSVRHMGYKDANVIDVVGEIVKDVPKLQEKIDRFQSIKLGEDEKEFFAKAALLARYGEEKLSTIVNPTVVNISRRNDDADDNLWNVFNRVQENLIKGGRRIHSRIDNQLSVRKITKVKSISEENRLNKALWLLTEKMAELVK